MAYELLLFKYYYYSRCFASAKRIWKLHKTWNASLGKKNAPAQPTASGFVQWNWSTMHGFTKQGIAHCHVTFGMRRLKWTNQGSRGRVTRGETEREVERERHSCTGLHICIFPPLSLTVWHVVWLGLCQMSSSSDSWIQADQFSRVHLSVLVS